MASNNTFGESGINISASRDILTTDEAAAYLAKSPSYLRNNCRQLGIKTYKVGKQLRFRKSELDQWLDGQAL
jgi:excisionase family DNA binding protein